MNMVSRETNEAQQKAIQEQMIPMMIQSHEQAKSPLPDLNSIAAAHIDESSLAERDLVEAKLAGKKQLAEL